MVNIINFADAIKDSNQFKKKHLLLGNGFSIACRPKIFTYGSLFDQADFSNSPHLKSVFDALGSTDFEKVIKSLEDASKVLPEYAEDLVGISNQMQEDADTLKDLLISTVANNHPEIPNNLTDEEFKSCRRFLANFIGKGNDGKVYTLNYDLLLYWAMMHLIDDDPDAIALETNDGFGRNDDTDPEYVDWMSESNFGQRVFYLHGALHLFDSGPELQKYTWVNTGRPLLVQAREAMEDDKFPLFVAEGSSKQKLGKIKHNAYLHHAYKSFSTQMDQKSQCLFLFGHSLDANDAHILKKIEKGKVEKIYIGLYGDEDEEWNVSIIKAAEGIVRRRPEKKGLLEVAYFDTDTANIWG